MQSKWPFTNQCNLDPWKDCKINRPKQYTEQYIKEFNSRFVNPLGGYNAIVPRKEEHRKEHNGTEASQ